MYAYCLNNPVNSKDPTGQVSITALIGAGYVTYKIVSSSYVRRTIAAFQISGSYHPSDSIEYNCYAHIFGEKTWKYVGGSKDAVTDFDVDVVAEMVLADAERDGRSIRPISSYDAPINKNEYRIALRTASNDYHFMVQHNDGSWSHKPGVGKTRLANGTNPSVMSWDVPEFDEFYLYSLGVALEIDTKYNYYDSDTRYFAVSKIGW